MRFITALMVALALMLAACEGSGIESPTTEEPATTTQAQEPTVTTEAPGQDVEAVDAKVVFDGQTCSYLGPAVIPAGAEVAFEFDDSAHPAALIVLLVESGTTWDQVLEDTGPGTARVEPSWVVDYWAQIEAGSLVKTLDEGDYLVTCNTAPDDTDAVHPAALIEVIDG